MTKSTTFPDFTGQGDARAAMNDSMTDEQFAKWLQDEEFRQQRTAGSSSNAQNEERLAAERADEEFARRLAAEQEQERSQHQSQQMLPQPTAMNNPIALQHGQTIAVRLQHPSSKNQIDEALYAHHVDRNVMMFEMVRKRGTYLRVKDTSEAEFSRVVDESSQFSIENVAGGMLYLGPRKHINKVNLAGSVGWLLALSHNGALIGNASRSTMSQWRLLAAPDAPPYAPLNSPAPILTSSTAGGMGPVPVPVPSSQLNTASGSDVVNPLMAASASPESIRANNSRAENNVARREAHEASQASWLNSAIGQTWLSQDLPGRSQLKQMHEDGKLQKLMYRPDWPKAALEWKDYKLLHHQYLEQELLLGGGVQVNFEEFFEKGYTVCPGAVADANVLNNALKMINYWLGQYPNHPSINAQGNIDLTGEILTDQSMLALLYETPLIHILKGFFKDDVVIKPCLECQISLRFPNLSASDDTPNFSGKRWHIDKECGSYSLLIGIPLSATTNVVCENEGNLCVFPGKQSEVHAALSAASRHEERGGGVGTTLGRMADVMDMSKPDFGEPLQLQMEVGDVVLISPFSPRREAPNFSPHTNYMVYFRCSSA